MGLISQYRSSSVIIFIILLCILFFTTCINNEKDKHDDNTLNKNYEKFAGSGKCISCHKNIYDSHMQTAHFLTSLPATAKSIKGSFATPGNTFTYQNGSVIAMEKRADSFYQVGYINGVEKKGQRLDMVIGSGTKGQSYASWQNNKLVQLPITYFTSAGQWANSPGYPNHIAFNRPITSRCLECHATYADKISAEGKEPELFDRNRLILGVDCEKCHGPAAKHVEFQTQNPKDTQARFIINPATFTRLQSLDMCSLCHGGRMQKSKPSFEFIAGDKLSDYFRMDTVRKDTAGIDVHGNQYALLAASKCFTKTSTLTCVSCHNTHENEQGKTTLFSQKCFSCHNDGHTNAVVCKLTAKHAKVIKANCTKCHMPQQPSLAIAVMLQGQTNPARAMMHTHYIKVYPEESKNILAFLQKQ
jgi:nitrate/TMAO reductase-like tetraheme cytochrome c subunit